MMGDIIRIFYVQLMQEVYLESLYLRIVTNFKFYVYGIVRIYIYRLRFLFIIRKCHIWYEGCRSSKLEMEECHDVLLPDIVDDHKNFSFGTETLD